LCCVERAIYCGIGGFIGCRTIPWPALRMMYTMTLPLNFLTTALTAAYLHEVLTTKSPLGTMVQKTKKPLCCMTIYYLLTDWPLSLISAFNLFLGSGVLGSISSGLLTAGTGITACLLLYITIRLGRYYHKKTPKNNNERSSVGRASSGRSSVGSKEEKEKAPPDRLKELLSRVQISTFWLLWTTAGLAATLLPQFHEPVGFAVINIWIFTGLNTTSLMHILAYGKTPKIVSRSSISMRASASDNTVVRKPKMPNLAVVVPADSSSVGSHDSPKPSSPTESVDPSSLDGSLRTHASSVDEDLLRAQLVDERRLTAEGYDELEG